MIGIKSATIQSWLRKKILNTSNFFYQGFFFNRNIHSLFQDRMGILSPPLVQQTSHVSIKRGRCFLSHRRSYPPSPQSIRSDIYSAPLWQIVVSSLCVDVGLVRYVYFRKGSLTRPGKEGVDGVLVQLLFARPSTHSQAPRAVCAPSATTTTSGASDFGIPQAAGCFQTQSRTVQGYVGDPTPLFPLTPISSGERSQAGVDPLKCHLRKGSTVHPAP